MAWIEQTRGQRNRVYRDTSDPARRFASLRMPPLHCESILDSGNYDAEVDLSPVRVDNPQFDGWQVTQAGWHYALGKDLETHGDADGWVGFGGRQGAHWFKFRLLRVGYLHWPTRAWDDIGGAPTYDRADLSQEARSLTVGPNADAVTVASVATWRNVWATPGGGELSASWGASGDGLKEEIVINQAGREWMATNRLPGTPLDETWFGFVFRLDWSGVPRVVKGGVQQDVDADWADDGEAVELRDALDRLLAFLPVGYVTAGEPSPSNYQAPLHKRFWRDADEHYLLVGVRCDTLNGLQAGDLTFDPTVNLQVGASADDANETAGGTVNLTNTEVTIAAAGAHLGFRWQDVTVVKNSTINSADLQIYLTDTSYDDAYFDIYGEDVDSASEFTTSTNDIQDRTHTSAKVDWDETSIGTGWQSAPDVSTIVDEITSRGSWASGNDMVIVMDAMSASVAFKCRMWDYSGNAHGAKLDIDYTVPTVSHQTSAQLSGTKTATHVATASLQITSTVSHTADAGPLKETRTATHDTWASIEFIPMHVATAILSATGSTSHIATGILIDPIPPAPSTSDSFVRVLIGDLDGRLLAELTCRVGAVAWRLKGPSCTTLEIAKGDAKAIEKYIRPGNRVLLQFANGLPDWGGFVDLPMKWTQRGAIQFCARSMDFLLNLRQTDQERTFTSATAGQIAKELIDDANNLHPMGIAVGEVWMGGESYTLSYHYDDLYKIIDQDLTAPGLSSGDFWIEVEEEDGYIVSTARFAERRGKERQEVAFVEGHNISDVTLTTQGPIVNSLTVIGAGNAWGENRASGYAEDAYSISLYGLRQGAESRTDIGIDAQLDGVADSMVAKYKQPHHVLTLGVMDLAPGAFASYDVGDSVRVILETFGFGGYDEMVRVRAREYNPMTGRCKLVVEEDVVEES